MGGEDQLKALIRQAFSEKNVSDRAVLDVDELLGRVMLSVRRLVETLPPESRSVNSVMCASRAPTRLRRRRLARAKQRLVERYVQKRVWVAWPADAALFPDANPGYPGVVLDVVLTCFPIL